MGCNSSAPASEPGARGGNKGIIAKVEWMYFAGLGRGDPLYQMFEYHGQPHSKHGWDVQDGSWDKAKAEGKGGEFGGGLPQANISDKGKSQNMGQFGAILRSFGIRYGYYNPKDWKCSMYVDPIVDTWADYMGGLSKVIFGGATPELIQEFIKDDGIALKFVRLIERTLAHSPGKFIAGDKMSIADFIAVSFIANYLMNDAFPCKGPLSAAVDGIAASTPKFTAYRAVVLNECKVWLDKRPKPLPMF